MDEPEVYVVSDDGIKKQFGKGAFYRREVANSKKVGVICVAILALCALPVFLTNAPEPERESRSDLGFNGDVKSQADSSKYGFSKHDETQAAKQNENNQKFSERKKSATIGSKEKFLGPELIVRPKNYKIPPGIMVKAILVSGASNGPVKARLTEPVANNGETFIEADSVLLGQGSSTEERLFVHFTKIILKDGSVENIQAQAADFEDKIIGLSGSKVGHHALRLAASVGLNFVSGMSEGLQESSGQNGVLVKKASPRNALFNGAGRAASQEAQDIISSAKNKQPIIEVRANSLIYVLFTDNHLE